MTARTRRRGILAGATTVLAIAAVTVLAIATRGGGDAVSVRVEPREALLDAPLRLEVEGARAGEPVRLELSATSADGVRWTGSRTVRADDEGRISADGGALVVSLRPTGVPGSAKLGLFPTGDALAVRLHLEARAANHVLGEASGVRRMVGAGVSFRELTVTRDGLAARYWTGPARDRLSTGILAVGGSEGGFGNTWTAALLASHGYPVLQLAYFGAPGLPRKLHAIPLEYVQRALEWLHGRPGVTSVVMIGASRGAELALVVGSTYPELVQGVAAYAPFDTVGRGSWTRAGTSIPSAANPDPRIPVEQIRGPVLLVGGGLDQVWDSGYGVRAVESRMREHGKKDTEAFVFDNAGHLVDVAIPYLPMPTEFPLSGFTLVSGGTREADVRARTASWPRLLALLQRVGHDSG